MPIPDHPLYDELAEILQCLPPEYKQTVWNAIVEEIAKPGTTDQLLSVIKNLADQAASVDEAFRSVRSGLKKLDEDSVKDKDGRPIPKYHSRWVGFQKRWTKLLWDSYRTATSAEVYIDEFVTTIIPVVEDIQTDQDRDDAIKDLKQFSKRKDVERTGDDATEYSKAFRDLRNEIGDFSIEFERVIVKISAIHKESVERLRNLGDEIFRCQTIVKFFFNEIGDGAGKGMIMALSSFKPALVIKILVSSLTKAGVSSSLGSHGELDSPTSKFTEARENLGNLEVFLRTLERNKDRIDSATVGLEQFGLVWALVADDADMIAKQLDVVTTGSMKAFTLRIRHLKAGYKGLGDALRQYTIQLDRPGVKKPNETDAQQIDMHRKERPQEALRESNQKDDVVGNKCRREEKVGDEKVRQGWGLWGIRTKIASIFLFL